MITIHVLLLAAIILVVFLLGFFIAKNMAKHNPARYAKVDLEADRASEALRDAGQRVRGTYDNVKTKLGE